MASSVERPEVNPDCSNLLLLRSIQQLKNHENWFTFADVIIKINVTRM